MKPNRRSSHPHLSTDRLGLRNSKWGLPKREGEKKVLILGDSAAIYTWAQINEELKRNHLAGNTRVYLGAAPAYSTLQELALYRQYARRVHPRLVLVYFATLHFDFNLRMKKFLDGSHIFSTLHLFRWARSHESVRFPDRDALLDYYRHILLELKRDFRDEAHSLTFQTLTVLRNQVESDGARMALVFAPDAMEVDPQGVVRFLKTDSRVLPSQVGASRKWFKKSCRSLGVPCLDLTPILVKKGGVSLYDLENFDTHWNREGSRIVAKNVVNFATELLSENSP